MSERETQDRTEEPTQHRLDEARRQGNVARSRDLTVASGLAAAAAALYWLGPTSGDGLIDVVRVGLGSAQARAAGLTAAGAAGLGGDLLARAVLGLAPVALACFLAATAVGLWQAGGVWRWEALGPEWSRLSPMQGLARICRWRRLARVAVGLVQVVWVGWLLWRAAPELIAAPARLASRAPGGLRSAWDATVAAGSTFCLQAAAGLLALAWLDYALELWLHRRDLRMSRQELVQEIQELDGDPEVKQRRRRLRQTWNAAQPQHIAAGGG